MRDPDNSVCTTFGVVERSVEKEDKDRFVWTFECTRCGHDQRCVGDPREFAGRPYSCEGCRWVSLLEQDALEAFAEKHADGVGE